MNKVLLTLLTLFFYQAKAQRTVSGIISDKTDKTLLLQGVLIFIPESGSVDYSKEGGTYILRNVGKGVLGLQFTKRGYKTVYKTIQTFDTNTVVNVEMESYEGPLQEVTDVSQLQKLPVNSPLPVQLFSTQQYNRKGSGSLLRNLAYAPGMDFYSYGAISKPMIRGLSFNHIALYQSGVPILYQSWNEYTHYELIEEGTGLVEVIKGPASLLYGDNAIGGALIYRDEKLPDAGDVIGDINLGFFTNTVGINLDASVKGSGVRGMYFDFRFGGKTHTSYIQGEGDKALKNTEQKDFAYHSGFNSGMMRGIVGVNKQWGGSKFVFSYLRSQYGIVTSLDETAIGLIEESKERKRKLTEPFISQSLITAANESVFLLKKSQLKINLSVQGNNEKKVEKYFAANADIKIISDPTKRLGYTLGGQVQMQRFGEQVADTFPDFRKSGAGLFLLFRYDYKKVNILAGGRWDVRKIKDEYSGTESDFSLGSGSIGIAYHPFETVTLKLSETTGFSIPDQQRHNFYSYDLIIVPSLLKKVVAEKSYGSDFEFSWNNKTFSVQVNAFYNLINNYSFLKNNSIVIHTPGFPYSYTFEQEDAELKGGEFSIRVHPASVKWLLFESTYARVRGKLKDSELNLPFIPADKVTAFITFRSERMDYLYKPFITLGARSYLKQDRPYISETITDAFTLFDIHLGGSFLIGQQDFDVTISLNNLLNEGYYSPVSRLKYLSPVAVRESGRGIGLQFRMPIGLKKSKQ